MSSHHTPSLSILPYPAQTAVACLPWNPRAPEVAARLVATITDSRPWLLCEHIGSTAVPGCSGKGIVDLMLLYPDGRLGETKIILAGLGFQPQTYGYFWPEERPMRVGACADGGELFLIHVHVIHADATEVASLRAFRDRLRADAEFRDAYVEEKRRICADGVETRAEYTHIKGAFIQRMS